MYVPKDTNVLNIGGGCNVEQNLVVQGDATFKGNLEVKGDLTVRGKIYAASDVIKPEPSPVPTFMPTTSKPSSVPTAAPTGEPTGEPSGGPTHAPTFVPTVTTWFVRNETELSNAIASDTYIRLKSDIVLSCCSGGTASAFEIAGVTGLVIDGGGEFTIGFSSSSSTNGRIFLITSS